MPLGNLDDDDEETTTTTNTSTTDETTTTEETNLPDVSFVIEDGSGVEDANSYCDLDFALEYAVMKGYDSWTSLTENQQKIFLIRGTEFVDNFYTWKGRKRSQFQGLSFPRIELYDSDRFEVRGIPTALKKACIEAAYLNSTSSATTLFSTKDENGAIKRQKVDSLEVEYFSNSESNSGSDSSSSSVDYTSIYDILNKLLKGLYRTSDEAVGISTKVYWRE